MGTSSKAMMAISGLAAVLFCRPHPASYANPSTPMGIPLVPPAKAWLTKPWTGDNRPFEAAFAQLRAEGKRGGYTEAALRRIRDREKASAQGQPLNLLAHVRWLFAASRVAEVNHEFDPEALGSVARLDPGTFRSVARTRYVAVMAADDNGTHPEIAGIGGRLVAAYPQDTWLRGRYIRDLAQGQVTLPRAVALSDAWVREAPQSPKSHATRAMVAMRQWFTSHQRNRVAAQRVVAEYRDFIRLSPPTEKDIAAAKDTVAVVTKMAGLRPPPR